MTIIDNLLDKYWAGETSLEEETQLRDYFSGSGVADQHALFADIFIYQNETVEDRLPDDFEKELLAEIANRESTTAVKSLPRYRRLLAVAAAVLFLGISGIFLLRTPTPSNDLADIPHLIINGKIYYPATEAEAYQLTKQALLLVSSKMTKEPKASIKSIKKIENVNPASWGIK